MGDITVEMIQILRIRVQRIQGWEIGHAGKPYCITGISNLDIQQSRKLLSNYVACNRKGLLFRRFWFIKGRSKVIATHYILPKCDVTLYEKVVSRSTIGTKTCYRFLNFSFAWVSNFPHRWLSPQSGTTVDPLNFPRHVA